MATGKADDVVALLLVFIPLSTEISAAVLQPQNYGGTRTRRGTTVYLSRADYRKNLRRV